MSPLHSLILGIIEGITEFLPISSTGHLIIASKLMDLPQTEILKTFSISIQLGAILSVIVLYWRSFFVELPILKKVIIAFIPTAIIGFLLYKLIKHFLLGNSLIVIWSLLLGGIILIIFELFHQEEKSATKEISSISSKQAFLIGIAQSIAIIPGVSRSAATILGGLFLGLNRKTIVEFSFLLAVPTMLAATAYDLLKTWSEFQTNDLSLLSIGFITSFIVALLSIKFLLSYIKNHTFISFGIYRIIAAIIFFILIY